MNNYLRISIFFILAVVSGFIFFCADISRDNIYDRESGSYIGYPIAEFNANGSTTVSIYQPVVFSASASSNPSGSTLTYRWLFSSAGTWTEWLNTTTITKNYTETGYDDVTLKVRNPEGMIGQTSKNISIVDSEAPVASFTFFPTSPGYGGTVTFDASGSTDDDSTASEIEVKWDFKNDGTFDTEWRATKTATHVYSTIGDYTVKVAVKDKYGIASETTSAMTVKNVPGDGLVAYYPFNGNAVDESGNGNNGTVDGAVLTEDRFGNAQRAYSFDGIDDWIDIPYSHTFDVTGAFSLEAWVFTKTIGGLSQYILQRGRGGDPEAYYRMILLDTGAVRFFWEENGGEDHSLFSTSQLSENIWFQLVCVFDGNNSLIYINSVLDSITDEGGAVPDVTTANRPLIIGRNWNSSGEHGGYFNGQIDDIRIYNRALTETEVQDLYQENGWTGN